MSNKVTNSEFFGFSWPPKMASFKPKQHKKYKHSVLIGSKKDPDLDLEISFKNEKTAKATVALLRQAVNNLDVVYEKSELPVTNDEGIIL